MKTNKSFIFKSLLMQFLAIPTALSGLILAFASVGERLFNKYDYDARILLSGAASSLLAMLLGGIIAFLFLRLSKNKPGNDKTGFMTPLIPILYASVFAVVLSAALDASFESKLWFIYVLKNPFFLLVDFYLSFGGLNHFIPIVELMGYLGYALIYYVIQGRHNKSTSNKLSYQRKLIIAASCIFVFTYSGLISEEVVQNGILELRYGKSSLNKELTEYDLYQIAPFKENNGLAKPEKKSSLQFDKLEDMPTLDGATAAYPVYAAFAEACYGKLGEYYQAYIKSTEKGMYTAFVENGEYPWNIIRCSKTNGAYERLISGEVDIIFVAEPSKAQLENASTRGAELVLTPIGAEAFVFFTNISNPVEELTIEQIQNIYTGKFVNWKQLGGKNRSILAYQRPDDSGSQTIMVNKVMNGLDIQPPTMETQVDGMGGMIKEVASYKNAQNAIGYSFLYYSSTMVKSRQIKYIAVNGVKPSSETIRNKSYPFTIPIYAVILKSNQKETVTKMIDWILSEEGQWLIEKTGYMPIKE